MNSSSACSRQEHLANLPALIAALLHSLKAQRTGPDVKSAPSLLSTAMQAACVQCGIHVTGAELLELVTKTDGPEPSPKVARLRQGYCARRGCNSYYYRLELADVPGVNWSDVMSRAEIAPLVALDGRIDRSIASCVSDVLKPKHALSVGALATALLVLWVARQYYVGGTVPLLREPEKFQVDSFAAER